ncbi:MAG TPA: YafY family protein [Protaetiibacter sp.]|jgi:predicted DNA-binding transcriptional regulator YafY|nr:YafY family protein [Protaetiibacter sp.]
MLETSARLLRLLSLLQSRRDWTGSELAARLEVTTRTVRNDVSRLRRLDYPIEARPGVDGGYRLGAGGALPPLLLDDDEAVAIAIGLRSAVAGPVTGIEETSLRALTKLRNVLPSRLRRRVDAFTSHTLASGARGPLVDPGVLTVIAGACQNHERLRFEYQVPAGAVERRSVEPYRLINSRQRWYLMAWDLERDGWWNFRVDRIRPRTPLGPRFAPRPLPPDPEVAERVARDISESRWHFRAKVFVHASAEYVRDTVRIPVDVEPLSPDRCVFMPGADDPEMLAIYLGLLGVDFEVVDSPELAQALRTIGERYLRAADGQP